MIVTIIIVLLIGFGVYSTVQAWPGLSARETQTKTLSKLIRRWLGIALAVLTTIGLSATSTGLFAYIAFSYVSGLLQESLNLPEPVATLFAALSAIPLALAFKFSLSLNKWRRIAGLCFVFLLVAGFSFARYSMDDELTFSLDGRTTAGYSIRENGKIRRCVSPGKADRKTGAKCHTMTPRVKQFFDETTENEPTIFTEKTPDVFFNLQSGEPTIWFCPRGDETYRFSRIPIHNPWSGTACMAATPELVRMVRISKKEKPESETKEKPDQDEPAPPQKKKLALVPDSLEPVIPFHESFEDGHQGALVMRGGWKLDALPKETSCPEGSHCACVKGMGTLSIDISAEIPWFPLSDVMWNKETHYPTRLMRLRVFGRDLRIVVTIHGENLSEHSRNKKSRARLYHNVIDKDDPARSWARDGEIHTGRRDPIQLKSGWKTITAMVWGDELESKEDPVRTHEDPIKEWIERGKHVPCNWADKVVDVLPFVDDCRNNRIYKSKKVLETVDHKTVVDYPGARIFLADIVATMETERAYTNQATIKRRGSSPKSIVTLTPRLSVHNGEFWRRSHEWDGGPPKILYRIKGFEVAITHPYNGTICVDDIHIQ